MSTRSLPLVVMALALSSIAQAAPVALESGWTLQSSKKVAEKGDVVSTPKLVAKDWYPVTVPSTVFAGLVKNGVYPDPYFGMNLRQVPGVSYPISKNFSNIAMPEDSPYAVSWWFRKTFNLPADYKGKTVWLHFGGINFRANVWLNGQQVATDKDLAGAYRTYQLDVTAAAKAGGANVLAVEVFAPKEKDLAITFVDWNPAPPDKSMGLWREVYLTSSGPASLRHPFVASELTGPKGADLTVRTMVKNASAKMMSVTVKGKIQKLTFSQDVQLAPGEEKEVTFAPAQFPQLKLAEAKLWWPKQMGEPHLYDLSLEAVVGGKVSDRSATKFGVRSIKSELNADKKRFFTVNGKKLLIRGAGWTSDMMLRYDTQRIEDQLRYVQDMGLNTVRLEGKLEPPHFFEQTDKMGILVLAGWCCCDHWEKWQNWKPEDPGIAERSLRDQILRLRAHPSLLAWMNASDFPPPPEIEKLYLKVEDELHWPNPTISSATAKPTPISGESGVKMSGPYEWIPPRYWLEDKKERGGAYGFNSETSPGPAVPNVESLRKMFPADKLWPINEVWNYHAGGDVFINLNVFTAAMDARLGKASTVEEYATKSQVLAYEGIRAMFEAYSRNKYTSTGIIQWMLNNSWPGLYWHLYDFFLQPGGGYFAAKNALEPLHPMYSYDDGSIWVINSTYGEVKGLKLTAKLYDLEAREKWSKEAAVDAGPDAALRTFSLPADVVRGAGPVSFVRLTLADAAGKQVGSGFYWLSSKDEKLDWPKSSWYMTPVTQYGDYTALGKLPKVTLKVTSKHERQGKDGLSRVTLENPSKSIAFFVRLKVAKGANGEEILPVMWQDNYVSLLPGEKRELTARYRAKDLGTAKPSVEVTGYNLAQ